MKEIIILNNQKNIGKEDAEEKERKRKETKIGGKRKHNNLGRNDLFRILLISITSLINKGTIKSLSVIFLFHIFALREYIAFFCYKK